ncbi:MAG: nitrate reductase cytochrome c-type subunit [Sulfurimonas sp.]|nr:nitrate reductase cytochrome c-type subunit [Sulfurimonadaceae bacterium]
MKIAIKTMLLATLLLSGCSLEKQSSAKDYEKVDATISEESIGLRKTDLYSENTTVASKTEYVSDQPMSSSRLQRAFQDAPPMIPHDVTGLIPIKKDDNRCTSCHMPDMAEAVGATPIPVSHFTDFRPREYFDKDGNPINPVNNYKNETKIVKTDELQHARFNCTQCHAPQSQGNLAVENTFQPDFVAKDGKSKSSWNEGEYTRYLNTVIGGDSFVTEDDIANKDSKAGY